MAAKVKQACILVVVVFVSAAVIPTKALRLSEFKALLPWDFGCSPEAILFSSLQQCLVSSAVSGPPYFQHDPPWLPKYNLLT